MKGIQVERNIVLDERFRNKLYIKVDRIMY